MPGLPPTYCGVYFGLLTEDVEALLARFQQTDSVRFEVFSAIWREMGFADLFRGTISVGEMKRFCRVAMATAVKYFLPPYSYQIRVGGLYLMFGFFHTQLASPLVKVRLALQDWAEVQKFLRDSLASGHEDVVYVFWKMVAARALHYVAMPHLLTFQKRKRRREEPVCAGFLGRATAVQELASADLLEEAANVQNQYEKLKEATPGVHRQVAVTHPDLSARLAACVSEFTAWQQTTFAPPGGPDAAGPPSEAEACGRRARLLSAIKQKGYGNKAPKSGRPEAADSSSSGAEQVREASAGSARQRPPSLRARTRESLGLTWEKRTINAWLLSVPETQDRSPGRRNHKPAASSPA